MRITPRQHIQAAKKPKKANPMARARVARQVPQMRKVFKGVTGVKKGGSMGNSPTEKLSKLKNPMAKERFASGQNARFKKALDKLIESLPKRSMKDIDKILNRKRAGGVIRPKPTFKGKVLKPKPIKDKRGIGIAIRGIGKAFKKGN